jgi:hypothetical protein
VQALERAREKEAAAQAADALSAKLQQRTEQLSAELDALKAEAAELRAEAETQGAAVEGLHATLERIERAGAEQAGSDRQPSAYSMLLGDGRCELVDNFVTGNSGLMRRSRHCLFLCLCIPLPSTELAKVLPVGSGALPAVYVSVHPFAQHRACNTAWYLALICSRQSTAWWWHNAWAPE